MNNQLKGDNSSKSELVMDGTNIIDLAATAVIRRPVKGAKRQRKKKAWVPRPVSFSFLATTHILCTINSSLLCFRGQVM